MYNFMLKWLLIFNNLSDLALQNFNSRVHRFLHMRHDRQPLAIEVLRYQINFIIIYYFIFSSLFCSLTFSSNIFSNLDSNNISI